MNMWIYKAKEISDEAVPEKAIGFLYKITQLSTGKFYYGRKLLTKAATKTVKGKKISIRKDSDWKDYWSSSPTLIELIESVGKDDFKREILMFVDTKASLVYGEEYILFSSGALFDENCINGNIRSRIQKKWFTKTPNLHSTLKSLKL